MRDSAILCLSGGLDSVVSAAMARSEHRLARAITFDYGQRAAAREIAAARRFCDAWDLPHEAIALPWLRPITTSALVNRDANLPHYDAEGLRDLSRQERSAAAVWVPNRNGIFIAIAAAYAEASKAAWIVTGFNAEEAATFPDNSAKFVERTNALLEQATLSHPKVVSYTQEMTKVEILMQARAMEIDLNWCWPCYEGGEAWCGACESCARFQRALAEENA